jgi:hypothetical protein
MFSQTYRLGDYLRPVVNLKCLALALSWGVMVVCDGRGGSQQSNSRVENGKSLFVERMC